LISILIFHLAQWKWGISNGFKAEAIVVDKYGLTCSRITTEGRNPSVKTTEPLTRRKPNFRVQIVKLGPWVGVGKFLVKYRTFCSKSPYWNSLFWVSEIAVVSDDLNFKSSSFATLNLLENLFLVYSTLSPILSGILNLLLNRSG
jgi:hypothetical protein